jgi:hypothetical protein
VAFPDHDEARDLGNRRVDEIAASQTPILIRAEGAHFKRWCNSRFFAFNIDCPAASRISACLKI